MNKIAFLLVFFLLAMSCKKDKTTAPGSPGGISTETLVGYFPGLSILKAGTDVITVTGTGKPGTIAHAGVSYSIWLGSDKKNIVTGGSQTGWNYSIVITDQVSGRNATGSLGRYEYLGGRAYYMLFLSANSLFSSPVFVDSL